MKIIHICLLQIFLFPVFLQAQPFVDPVNFNQQSFQSLSKDSLHILTQRLDNNLGIFFPKKFKNDNVFLFKVNAEWLRTTITENSVIAHADLFSYSMPVGFQFVSRNKKWKSLFMAIPKISSDCRDNLSHDFQYGGIALETFVINDSLKIKFGLFYNKECFGNFFVPLVGIDWKINSRWNIYGTLPNNMKVEYKIGNNFYAGLAFKNYKRSYRLSAEVNNDFILAKETNLRFFADQYLFKRKFVISVEAGYTINYSLLEYQSANPKQSGYHGPVYSPVKNNFVANVILAYRIRTD